MFFVGLLLSSCLSAEEQFLPNMINSGKHLVLFCLIAQQLPVNRSRVPFKAISALALEQGSGKSGQGTTRSDISAHFHFPSFPFPAPHPQRNL